MKKIIILIALVLTASTIFAKNSRKPANATEVQCQEQAGKAAQGAVQGLGQKDVIVGSVREDFIKAQYETYKVRLKGSGTTTETTKDITVKVTANEDGSCTLRSIEMPVELFE